MSQDLDRLPPQTKFIVGNEACERFSYYGVLALITGYMMDRLGYTEPDADQIIHYWLSAVYILPLLGAWIADRFWGRYHTILWISLAYCAGHAVLGIGEGTRWGLFAGLTLLAVGAGGIKPCVSAFVGDQFGKDREHLLPKVYGLFYWSINFGSFFAFAFLPGIKDQRGYGFAFALPGIAMAIALLLFWMGRKQYVMHPPSRREAAPSPAERAENRRALGKILLIFAPIVVFWTLFDQQHTTWIHQGRLLAPLDLGIFTIKSESMRLMNPLLVMALIPILTYVVYPSFRRWGINPTPLRRMGAGMVLAAISFFIAGVLDERAVQAAAAGTPMSLGMQLPQFIVLTTGEVLLSATGLEFAFSQAPKALKSTILSLWFLGVAVGNFLTATVKGINDHWLQLPRSGELHFYGGLMLVVAGIFAAIASRFPETSARPDQSLPER
jgi:proton-dependent oligopeptide transporter, POT family